MKINRAVLIVLILICSITIIASGQWKTTSSKDQMTGEEKWYAISPHVTSTSGMSFPYTGTEAWIGIGKDNDSEWIYIGFTNAPNLTNTNIGDGYSTVKIRIKWDDDLTEANLIQTWGGSSLQFLNGQEVISRIMKHNSVLIELDWFGNGKTYFEFPLSGSSNAIKTIREAFSK